MIASSLSWFGKACRDDACPLAAYSVGDSKQTLFDHPKQDEAVFAILLPPILADHCEDICEGKSRRRQAHAMIGEVLGCLGVIPFEIVVFARYYGLAVPSKHVTFPARGAERARKLRNAQFRSSEKFDVGGVTGTPITTTFA
jgi:hypothetical protein